MKNQNFGKVYQQKIYNRQVNRILKYLVSKILFLCLDQFQNMLIDQMRENKSNMKQVKMVKEKNFKLSDEIRDNLKELGIEIQDNKDGTTGYTIQSNNNEI